MSKFRLLSLFLFITSAHSFELTWDSEFGDKLNISSSGLDKMQEKWTIRNIDPVQDLSFYQDLYSNQDVVKTMGGGKGLTPERVASRVGVWGEGFANGLPIGKMTVIQNELPIGCIGLYKNSKRSGVAEFSRAFIPAVQGKGLGTSVLRFIVEEWAPAVRTIGLGNGQNKPYVAPQSATEKFRCFGGEVLEVLYATAKPSNQASWQCYKHFNFEPTAATDPSQIQITCAEWEQSHHGSLEDYIKGKYFSETSSTQLQVDVLYDMLDENEKPKTLSFVSDYDSFRYHFDHRVIVK